MKILSLLRRDRVVRVWFVATLQSWVGNGAAWPALALLAAARWHSGWAISLVLAADFVPMVLLGSFSGSLADKFSRRQLMVAAQVGGFLSFAFIFFTHSYLLLLIGALAAGTARSFYSPASKAVVGQLADKENVPVVSAMRSACQSIGFTLGPAIAAGLLLFVSPRWLLAIDALTFGIEALMLCTIPRFEPPADDDTEHRETYSRKGGVMAGVRALGAYRVALTLLITTAIGEAFAPILNVALVPFAKQLLHAGNSSVGLLATVTGLGLVAASVAMSRQISLRSQRTLYVLGWLAYGVSLPIMAYAPFLGVALVAKSVQGAANAVQMSTEVSLINETVPESLTGRVFGLMDAVCSASFAVSFMLAGIILSAGGAAVALAIAGAGCLLAGVLGGIGLYGGRASREFATAVPAAGEPVVPAIDPAVPAPAEL